MAGNNSKVKPNKSTNKKKTGNSPTITTKTKNTKTSSTPADQASALPQRITRSGSAPGTDTKGDDDTEDVLSSRPKKSLLSSTGFQKNQTSNPVKRAIFQPDNEKMKGM